MKIKIKDFNGLYTNNDENDNRLEVCKDTKNFFHKKGFLEIDTRQLVEWSELAGEMPLPNNNFTNYEWIFETGLYTTLSSDILSTQDTPTPAKHDCMIIIAKAEDDGTYHRLVYLKDLTESESGGGWLEMSKNGNGSATLAGGRKTIDIENHNGSHFPNSAFSTTLEGDVHFQVEDGRLKIYLPHDAFWLGKIDRKIYAHDFQHTWPQTDPDTSEVTYPFHDYEQDYWYIDRLTEVWTHDYQRIRLWDQDNVGQIPWIDYNGITGHGVTCSKGTPADNYTRRLGISYKLFAETDPTHQVGGRNITVGEFHNHKIYKEQGWSNYRCVRSTITSEDGVPLVNPLGAGIIEGNQDPSIFPFWVEASRTTGTITAPGGVEGDWEFEHDQEEFIFLTFLPYGNETFSPQVGDVGDIGSYQLHVPGTNNAQVWIGDDTKHDIPEGCWSISLKDYLSVDWKYSGDLETQDVGWGATENKFSIIVTAVLDDREEIPISAFNWQVSVDTEYVLTISNVSIPYNFNKRTTRIKFYHKLKDATDYEMVKEMDLLDKEATIEQFDISTDVYDGFFLATQTGFLWDYYERPADYKIMTGWKDFVTESGISIGISTRDEVAIYHSTFGGGNLMPDLVYDDNRLPITGVSELTAVGNADGRLMAFSPHTAYVVHAQEIAGVIAFRFEDTVEVGVKDKNDVANIQGGVLVHTRHGIYITNGYETKSISVPIDDIIKENYATGRVYYNRYEHEVYYKPTDAEDLYRFRMIDSVWEKMDRTA